VETQTTIGYGTRAITENCGVGTLIISMQGIVGVVINAAMAGIIFSKFTIPANRAETIVFSKYATVTMRNGCLFLLCRVADLRTKSLLEATVRMFYFENQEVTHDGLTKPCDMKEIKCGVQVDGTQSRLLLIWPTVISHKIDECSPLFEMNPTDLNASDFELVVTFSGQIEETGKHIQVRTSYLPNEIFWGYNFDNNVMEYNTNFGTYYLRTKEITNKIERNDYTPQISAKQLWKHKKTKIKSKYCIGSEANFVGKLSSSSIETKKLNGNEEKEKYMNGESIELIPKFERDVQSVSAIIEQKRL
jgi:potassium inwardly-rectifying channel subfamily J